jgi:hypothetical protein
MDTTRCEFNTIRCIEMCQEIVCRWFWQDGEKWLPFHREISGKIENKFAIDPRAKFSCYVNSDYCTINLETKEISTPNGERRAVKRLPHASSIAGTGRRHSRIWIWEWEKRDDVWVEFDGSLGGITSDDVEEAFKNDPQAALEFYVNKTPYVIDLKHKAQINQLTNTGRRIRRKLLTTAEVNIYPSHWTDITEELRLVPIGVGGLTAPEFRKVSTLFLQAMPNFKIHSIERVQNSRLYEMFHACKNQVAGRLGRDKSVRYLLHGTKNSSINAICQRGFNSQLDDMRMYGKGCYFARDVTSYSKLYANCNAAFLAKVKISTLLHRNSYRGVLLRTFPHSCNSFIVLRTNMK